VVSHAGASCGRDGATDCAGEIVDLARDVREPIDAIVSGHTHSLVNAVVNGIPILQARSNGRAVAVLDLPVGAPAGRALALEVRDVLTDSLRPDPATARLVDRALASVRRTVSRPVATVPAHLARTRDQYPLGHLIADAMRVQGGGDVAVMNNGGIRADLPAGTATYGTLFDIQPFGNTLYRLTVRGRDLRTYLTRQVNGRGVPRIHVSGVRIAYDSTQPAGSRVADIRLADGRTIDDAATYRLIMNDFMATGGDGLGLGTAALKTEPLPIVDLDAFIAYLRSRPQPIAAPTEQRIFYRLPQ